MDKIKELADQSFDIESDNVIKRYQSRPKQLEKLCFAHFVTWFNCKSESNQQKTFNPIAKSAVVTDDCLPENDFNDNVDDDLSGNNNVLHESDKYEMKVAPTGKAAFNIGGNNLHSAFKIPANRGFSYCTLDRDRLNTRRSRLQRMQVIFY